jgi:hypothetical protein
MAWGHEGREPGRRAPATPTPQRAEVNRWDPLPLGGARRRELAGQATRAALLPPHARHAVSVGAGVEAFGVTRRSGAQARSGVAETGASDDGEVRCPRPREAAPVPDQRGGRPAWPVAMAPGAAGRAPDPPGSWRAGLRRPGVCRATGPMRGTTMRTGRAAPARTGTSPCPLGVSRAWSLPARSSRARPAPWPQSPGFGWSPWAPRRWESAPP